MQLILLAAGKSERIYKFIGKNKCLIKVNKINELILNFLKQTVCN